MKKNPKDNSSNPKEIIIDSNSNKRYPFIDELVDKLYNKSLNDLIEKNISTSIDKKVFLMFVMMYFVVHLQLEDSSDKKDIIKNTLNELIGDKEKRKLFVNFFANKFDEIEFTEDNIKKINFILDDD